MRRIGLGVLALVMGVAAVVCVQPQVATAQEAAAAVPKQTGTVTAVSDGSLTLKTAAGQEFQVALSAATKYLLSADLKTTTPGAVTDIAVGDKAFVTGTPGDAGTVLTARRVILVKSSTIAAKQESDAAAWQQGVGGIVKSVDAAGVVTLSSSGRSITVTTSAKTIVRRYAPGSVKFEDATLSTLSALKPGDQLRVRGTKSADGLSIAADEVVAGSFANYSGLLTGINATAGTVTLKDLATKKVVTVAVAASTEVHRLPAAMGAGIAARLKGASAAGAARREGNGLSGMMSRLPTETLGGMKAGEAVMIVATEAATATGPATAVTLLVGVDAILASSGGETMTLSPWSLSGGGGGEEGGGGE